MLSDRIIELAYDSLYSPISNDYDTRPAEVTTFVPRRYPELIDDLNQYSSLLKNKDSHRLLENYTDIDFNEFPFVTVLKQNNIIVGFSTGYTREFYPNGCIRILNRHYQDNENLRINFTREILRPTTFAIVEQQLEMSRRLNYNTAIITREPRTHRFFTNFVNSMSNRGSQKWELRKGPYLLTPSYNNPKAWQSIAYTKFKDTKEDFWQHWRTK